LNIFDLFDKIKKQNDQKNKIITPVEYIIVGLGNPGIRFVNTRHNVGFSAVDFIAEKLSVTIKKIKFKSTIAECKISEKRCLLMKPSTYMNLSGQAVIEAMQFYKIPIQKVIVLHDDVAIPFSNLRIRRKGSDGGQNGLKNIIYLSGSDEFLRVKIGVDSPPHPDYSLADWVLSTFTNNEIKSLKEQYEKIYEILELLVCDKVNEAMNKYN